MKMNAASDLPSRLRRLATVVAGCLGLASAGVSPAVPANAQETQYRPLSVMPPAWSDFAGKVQANLRERFAADDEPMVRVRRLLDERKDTSPSGRSVTAKIWTAPDGGIERIEFRGLDEDIAVALRAILARHNVGASPPPVMAQPIHLKLSLADATSAEDR